MDIHKCDRCGQIVDYLTIISTTIPKSETFQEKQEKETVSIFSMFPTYTSKQNTVSLEICDDCLKVLVRWLSHRENYLMKMRELAKKKV